MAQRSKYVLFVLFSLLIVAVVAVYQIGRDLRQTIHESYAVWWVADMVVEHLKTNEDQWPTSWDDLEDDYETCAERSGRPWTFEQLKSRARVDWNADVEQLRQSAMNSDAPEFRVIWAVSGSDHHWHHAEPNTIVWEYLRLSSVTQ